jgi:hypothetical protein
MKRFSTVTLGAAILMAATSVLAVDGTTVARRTSRQDILSGHAQTSSSNAAPIVADRADQAVLDQGLVPNQPVVPPEIDVAGVVFTTRSGLFLEGVKANLELRQNDVHSTIRLDRVQLDVNEMAEAMAAKTVTARPIVDRPILAGN